MKRPITLKTDIDDVYYYPIKLPANTKRIRVTRNNSALTLTHVVLVSTTMPSSYDWNAQMVTKVLESALVAEDNVYIFDIPTYDGYPEIDGMGLAFRRTDYASFTESCFDYLTSIEALPAE